MTNMLQFETVHSKKIATATTKINILLTFQFLAEGFMKCEID